MAYLYQLFSGIGYDLRDFMSSTHMLIDVVYRIFGFQKKNNKESGRSRRTEEQQRITLCLCLVHTTFHSTAAHILIFSYIHVRAVPIRFSFDYDFVFSLFILLCIEEDIMDIYDDNDNDIKERMKCRKFDDIISVLPFLHISIK